MIQIFLKKYHETSHIPSFIYCYVKFKFPLAVFLPELRLDAAVRTGEGWPGQAGGVARQAQGVLVGGEGGGRVGGEAGVGGGLLVGGVGPHLHQDTQY